jgi:DNA excision repair protein ERCC-1
VETVKAFNGKDPSSVIGKHEPKIHIKNVVCVLGSMPSVNKMDASQLLTQFGTFQDLVAASIDELDVCPGLGSKKVRRLYEVFHQPFSTKLAKRPKMSESGEEEHKEVQTKMSNNLEVDEDEVGSTATVSRDAIQKAAARVVAHGSSGAASC